MRLKTARDRIQDFKFLSSVFKNFDEYEKDVIAGNGLPRNIIFNFFASDYYKNSYNQSNLTKSQGTYYELKILEDALNQFLNQNSVTKLEYSEFLQRLTSRENFVSLEALDEIMIAYEISKKIGFDKVNLHGKLRNGKRPDY